MSSSSAWRRALVSKHASACNGSGRAVDPSSLSAPVGRAPRTIFGARSRRRFTRARCGGRSPRRADRSPGGGRARVHAPRARAPIAAGADPKRREPARDAGARLRHRHRRTRERSCATRQVPLRARLSKCGSPRAVSAPRWRNRERGADPHRAGFGRRLARSRPIAIDLPQESPVPGGVKIIRLDAGGSEPPYVEADGHRALVVQDGATWVAVVGIPLGRSSRIAPCERAESRRTARDRLHGRL